MDDSFNQKLWGEPPRSQEEIVTIKHSWCEPTMKEHHCSRKNKTKHNPERNLSGEQMEQQHQTNSKETGLKNKRKEKQWLSRAQNLGFYHIERSMDITTKPKETIEYPLLSRSNKASRTISTTILI